MKHDLLLCQSALALSEDGQKGVSDDATRDNRSSKEHRLRPKPKGSEHESSSEKRS